MAAIVVAWFFYKFSFFCFWKPFHRKAYSHDLGDLDDPCKGIRRYHLDHVRNLLKKEFKKSEEKKSAIKKIVHYLFPFKRNYKLPLLLLGAITAMVMIVYQLSFSLIARALTTLVQLADNYNQNVKPLFEQYNSSIFVTIDKTLSIFFIGIPTMIVVAPILSLLLSSFLLGHMISSISKTLKETAKHGFKGKLPPRHLRLAAYWTYLGAQIGLFLVAWILYFIIFLVLGVALLVIGLLLVVSRTTRGYALSLLVTVGIPMVWVKLLSIGQTLAAKYIFLEDRNEASKFIPVRHRRLYHWFGFVLFFYNGFAGLVGAVIRIVINMVFGILLLFRLDIQFLPSHLWWWDFGHKSYQGFIYMDYCYNNPVMHVFSHLLLVRQSGMEQEAEVELVGADIMMKPQNKRVRNRWFVAYTLIKNPPLQQYTANNIVLLAQQKELQKEKLFILEHVIKNVKKDQENLEKTRREKPKLAEEKLVVEELIGVELKPNEPGMTEEDGEEQKEILPLYPSLSVNEEVEPDLNPDKFHEQNYTKFT